MAKNVEINIKTDSGYEVLYPRVNGNNSDISVDISSQFGLDEDSSIGDVLSKIGNTGVFSGYTEKLENDYGDMWGSESYSIDIDNGTNGTRSKSAYYLGSYQNHLVFYDIYYKQTGIDDDEPFYSSWGLIVSFYNLNTKKKTEKQLIFPDNIATLSGLDVSPSSPIFLENNKNLLFFTINGVFVGNKNDFSFSFYSYKLLKKNRDDSTERAIYYNGVYACYFAYNVVYSTDLTKWSVSIMTESTHDFATVGGGYIWFVYHPNSALILYKSTSVNSIGTLVKQLRDYSYCSNCSQANGYLFLTGRSTSSSAYNYLIVYNIETGESYSNTYGREESSHYNLYNVFYSNDYYYGTLNTNTTATGKVFIKWNKGTTAQEINTNVLNARYLKTGLGTNVYCSEENNLCLCIFNNSGNWKTYNYTQYNYTRDYNLTNALSEVLNLGDSYRKIELTSYIGSGSYGSSNPTSVTFSFNPKMVVVTQKSNTGCSILLKGATIGRVLPETSSTYIWRNVTWIENGVQWYADALTGQYNDSGAIYLAIGIG